jgi:hypothetical protein
MVTVPVVIFASIAGVLRASLRRSCGSTPTLLLDSPDELADFPAMISSTSPPSGPGQQ